MNRHQSNPFLAGWEESEGGEVQAQIGGIFDMDNTIQSENENQAGGRETEVRSGESTTARRHSSSQADIVGNPFGAQRAADRRLYHRNMSSFEAASLQLEHQQQMHENGSSLPSADQTDLIAKMTADFQSAIETNDKQFAVGNDATNPIELNPFDPFETIVDDDISLPSPKTSSNQSTADKFEDLRLNQSTNESCANAERPQDINLDAQQKQQQHLYRNTHDSIDDDDEELVSTPVRNIKSSSQKPFNEGSMESKAEMQSSSWNEQDVPNVESNLEGDSKDTGSIAKASLFASLLASAESSGQQTMNDNIGKATVDHNGENNSPEANNVDHENLRGDVEHATHVIMGSLADGNVDRPVGFFDPFETVIDKDALTSLMNDNQQQQQSTQATNKPAYVVEEGSDNVSESNEDADDHNFSTADFIKHAKTPEPTPIHRSYPKDEDNCLHSNYADANFRPGLTVESASIETVIENASPSNQLNESQESITKISVEGFVDEDQTSSSCQQGDQQNFKKDNNDNGMSNSSALPRPTRKIEQPVEQSKQSDFATNSTPMKKPNKQKKKPSFQEDSSDSSDDDDRIQIVIKARDTSKKNESNTGPSLVPLLPPPPSKSSMKQARERGQVDDMPSPVMSYKTRHERKESDSSAEEIEVNKRDEKEVDSRIPKDSTMKEGEVRATKREQDEDNEVESEDDQDDHGGQFVIPMTHSDDEGDDAYAKPETPLYDEDTSYVLEEFPSRYDGPGWEMMLRYPPKKKLTSNRFWKKIFVKLTQVPIAPDSKSSKKELNEPPQTCIALQVFDKADDKKPMQEIPIQATYTVSDISSQQFDQFGKIFTIKLQYIFYKERVGVRQGQLARFIHSGHIGSSTTSGGHGADPISIGAIKRLGAPIEHSPQISQIIKLGCASYNDIKQFKNCLEDYLFKMPIHRDRALSTYKTEEVQMAVRDETYLELNQVGTIIRQLARVRLFFLSFLNGTPTVEVGINDIHRQGREVVGRMDILPVVTEEWIRLEDWEMHSTVEQSEFDNPDSRIIKLVPPDATFFELMRFRIRPPRNRELPLQISANMSVTRTKVSINCEVMVPGCVSRKHGQIPCEGIAIRVMIPECWIYFFREEKHFRMGSKKSVNRRPGKVKGIERFLGGGGLQDINDESSLIEVTSGQAKYEHHHNAIVWRAARWPKESQSAYVQNTMKIRLPLTAYDKMPENFYEYVHVEYTMPATTVSHTTLRSISVNPCDDEPPEKYVKYSAKYEYKVKMRLSVNLGGTKAGELQPEVSPIVIMKQPDLHGDLQREEDSDDGSDVDVNSDQGEDQ